MSSHVSKRFDLVRGNRGNQGKEFQAELYRWEFDEFNETIESWMNEDYGWDYEYWQEEENYIDEEDSREWIEWEDEHVALDDEMSHRELEEHDLVWSSYFEDPIDDQKAYAREAAFASMSPIHVHDDKYHINRSGFYREWGINE